MKNKSLTKFKFENVIFIVLVISYLINALTTSTEVNNSFGIYSSLNTLIAQITLSYSFKFLLGYMRKNPQTVATEIASLFKD